MTLVHFVQSCGFVAAEDIELRSLCVSEYGEICWRTSAGSIESISGRFHYGQGTPVRFRQLSKVEIWEIEPKTENAAERGA